MRWQTTVLTGSAILLGALLCACSLKPEARTTDPASDGRATPALKPAIPASFDLAGKVKADEFNDQAIQAEAPAQGGQVVIRFNAEPETLGTWLSTADAYTQYISFFYIYDTLLWENWETFELEPMLAELWLEEDIVVKQDGTKLRGTVTSGEEGGKSDVQMKTSEGETLRVPAREVKEIRKGVAFTFYLRRDVRFHDGKPFTAADVKFSLDTVLNENVDAPDMRQEFVDLESYQVLDPYTVRVTFAKPYWKPRKDLGRLEMLPKHIYDWDDLQEKDPKAFGKRFNESEYHRKPMGTGPYKFERWDTGQQVVLVRNEEYWNRGRRGHLDRPIFKFIDDPVPALQALKNGEVNFIPGRLTGAQFDTEMSDPEFLRKFAKVEFFTPGF